MCRITSCLFLGAFAATLAFAGQAAYAAQAAEVIAFEPGVQVRDAVLDAEQRHAFLAVYDRSQVWKVTLPGGGQAASAEVGLGPVALAFNADESVLACASHLTGEVTLLDPVDLSVIAKVSTGEGPVEVVFLKDHFVSVNSFADSVTYINAAAPDDARTIPHENSVAVAAAASAGRLAILTKVPASLLLYDAMGATASARAELPGEPVAAAALDGGRILVATKGQLLIVNGTDGAITAQRTFAAGDVAVFEGAPCALADGMLHVLDDALETVRTVPLESPAQALGAGGAALAMLSPGQKQWSVLGKRTALAPVLARAEEPKETPTAPPEVGKRTEREAAPVQSKPLGAERPVEDTDKRPAASPLERDRGETADSLGESLQIGLAPGGFEPPDFTQPLRQLGADGPIDIGEGGNPITARDNVRFVLDTIAFRADYLFYDRSTGEMHVRGNVEMEQNQSVAYADEIRYVLSPEAPEQLPPIESAGGEEDDLTTQMLKLGELDATNLEVREPNRTFKADRLLYDFANQSGQAYNVSGSAGKFYFGAAELDLLGPEEAYGEDMWLTTCDPEHEYYRIRLREASIKEGGAVMGKGAQLELGRAKTPVYWPRWGFRGRETPTVGVDFDAGKAAELGYYVNLGQQFAVSRNTTVGYRFWPTTKEGIGFGIDAKYDVVNEPAALLYGGKGSLRSLYTTDDRGYLHFYHRHDLWKDTVLLAQIEQWGDEDFYKDFYYDAYNDRSEPRTFANVTYTRPNHIVTGTVRQGTSGFVAETERRPEVTYHLLERRLLDRLYFTFDTVDGYNEREPSGAHSMRSANVARVSYDIEVSDWANITPFAEAEATWYSNTRKDGDSDARFSAMAGSTFQSRLHKTYGAKFGFEGFKHLFVPSVTLSYRPSSSLEVEESPRFDAYDNVYGRHRIETKIDNIVFARDPDIQQAWQVARLSLYHGNDFWNEFRQAEDYEMELDLRPRPRWGFQFIGEHHSITEEANIDEPYFLERSLIQLYEEFRGEPYDPEVAYRYNAQYGDYDRILSYIYYNDRDFGGRLDGRLGYAYTATQGDVFNREVIYGLGYKLGERWELEFEHRYDLERSDLYRQEYRVQRVFHCLTGAVQVRERGDGWDFSLEFSVTDIPGTRLSF